MKRKLAHNLRKLADSLAQQVFEQENKKPDLIDTIAVDTPLLIRLLEWSREEAADDVALHDLATRLVANTRDGRVLTMADYEALVGGIPTKPEEMY